MRKKIGFIGCGKMAQAMIEGFIQSNVVLRDDIIASSLSKETVLKVKEKSGISISVNNLDVAKIADFIFLAVKPSIYKEVIREIRKSVKSDAIIITIAAGISLNDVEEYFDSKIKAIRTMPNTPSLVGEGMTAICSNQWVTEKELQMVIQLFESIGKVEQVSENLMDAIPAVSGSSPAYVYMLIEAMADGAVLQGIPRNQAYTLAAQAVLGAAKMVLESNMHPGELKDNVCTPGGATIEAIASLEKNNFRSAVITAMESCTRKSKGLLKD